MRMHCLDALLPLSCSSGLAPYPPLLSFLSSLSSCMPVPLVHMEPCMTVHAVHALCTVRMLHSLRGHAESSPCIAGCVGLPHPRPCDDVPRVISLQRGSFLYPICRRSSAALVRVESPNCDARSRNPRPAVLPAAAACIDICCNVLPQEAFLQHAPLRLMQGTPHGRMHATARLA